MKRMKWRNSMIAIASMMVALSGVWRYARAQTDQNPVPNRQSLRVQRAGGGRGGAVVMAISGSNLFIVRGNVIYRLDANTLEIKKQADIPEIPVVNNAANFRNLNRNNGAPNNQRNQNFRSAQR